MNLFQVLKRIYDSNIRNFTIYYDKHHHLLFSHMEYIGKWDAEVVKLISNRLINQFINQSMTQSVHPSIHPSISQSITQPIIVNKTLRNRTCHDMALHDINLVGLSSFSPEDSTEVRL